MEVLKGDKRAVKPISNISRNSGVIIVSLFLAFLVLGVVSCAHRSLQVVPIKSQNVLTLSSDDVVRVMRRAGFSDGQISGNSRPDRRVRCRHENGTG